MLPFGISGRMKWRLLTYLSLISTSSFAIFGLAILACGPELLKE
jgi:hypothetical protein